MGRGEDLGFGTLILAWFSSSAGYASFVSLYVGTLSQVGHFLASRMFHFTSHGSQYAAKYIAS